MNYLSANNLSKSFGTKPLFRNLSFGLDRGQKAALVARNGAGKSTLLRIIAGLETSDEGEVRINKDIRWAYLPQEPVVEQEGTIRDYLFANGNPEVKALAQYHHAMAAYTEAATDAHLDLLQNATNQMEELKAWDVETRIGQLVGRFGLHDLEQPLSTLSGGQKKRVALANMLLEEPDLVIMDEPTNHLDLDMVEWLEEYLSGQQLSLLLVTHDRYFLDAICDTIFEIEQQQLYRHQGNYTYYLESKAERQAQEERTVDKARNLLKKELEWARRMPKARGTKAKYRMENVDKLQEKAQGKTSNDKLDLQVNMSRLGKKIIEITDLSKSFGEQPIVDKFSYIFKRGEKIGIVGKNGAGKSTFLNLITGQLAPDSGKIETGETLVIGYYTQQGIELPEDKRVIEVLQDIAEFVEMGNGTSLSASQLLLRFLFSSEQQYAYVSTLSGGERRRLYLLTILVRNPNFLILDEPTNDLDLLTLNVLEDFLDDFPGCLITVTHDRYFLDRLAEHLFVFEGAGKIRDFNGRYLEYRTEQAAIEREKKQTKEPAKAATAAPKPEKSVKSKVSFREKQEHRSLEQEIAGLEEEKAALGKQLSGEVVSHQELTELAAKHQKISDLLDEKMMRWLELDEKIND